MFFSFKYENRTVGGPQTGNRQPGFRKQKSAKNKREMLISEDIKTEIILEPKLSSAYLWSPYGFDNQRYEFSGS